MRQKFKNAFLELMEFYHLQTMPASQDVHGFPDAILRKRIVEESFTYPARPPSAARARDGLVGALIPEQGQTKQRSSTDHTVPS